VELVSCVRGLFGEVAVGGGKVGHGWWLAADDEAGVSRVVDGPFPDRADAAWAAGVHEHPGPDAVRPVYGLRRADGVLCSRPSPQEWAWLAHLGDQLDRLPEDWHADLSDEDPLATLVVEVAAAVAEAGLPLHDTTGPDREIGGACLTPEPALGGIVVTWRQHDRMSVDQIHGTDADAVVQQVMNHALAEVLRLRGFAVEAFGGASGHVVRPLA
jgi:hypothetical protein